VAACVRAILAQESPPPFEVVVADQSDDEATVGAVGVDDRVRSVRVSGRGRSRALNAGIRDARAPWIVVTDDDCRPAPDWLASIARAIEGLPARSVLVGRVIAGPKGPGAADPPAVLDRADAFDVSECGFEDWIYPNLAFPHAALDAIGGYDERLGVGTRIPGGEDNDWGYRLLRAGWTIAYRPGPVVVHEAWRSLEERQALKRAYGIGQGGFYAKHLAKLDPFMVLRIAYDLGRQAKGFTLAVLTARDRDARGHLAYAGGLVYGVFSMGELIVRGVPERGEP
jgi:GT2 family glycosyltransferase